LVAAAVHGALLERSTAVAPTLSLCAASRAAPSLRTVTGALGLVPDLLALASHGLDTVFAGRALTRSGRIAKLGALLVLIASDSGDGLLVDVIDGRQSRPRRKRQYEGRRHDECGSPEHVENLLRGSWFVVRGLDVSTPWNRGEVKMRATVP